MQVYGLLGRSLSHSYSPDIHAMMADYEYKLFEVEPQDLERFLNAKNFDGLNVTIPYKTAVMAYCDELSAEAKAIGSVNTIVKRADGTLYGDNTDAYGFLHMISHSGINIAGKAVLVLGSGGASLTACHVLKEQKAKSVVVISRSGKDNYENIAQHADADVIVNTTPVGMYPNIGQSPVDLSQFIKLSGVLDLVYNPARTQLAMDAEKRSIPCETGLSMLVGQAKRAVEIFTGNTVPTETEKKTLAMLNEQMQNIVLVGMPASGKSTVAVPLAQRMGKRFVDADEALEQAAGMTIAEIFETEGEEGFRQRETEVLEELGKQSGCVIATGGGCVTRAENYPALHQNGVIVWLQRDIAELITEGRPISQKNNLHELYEKRKQLYAQFADIIVVNDACADSVAERIWEAVHENFSH